MNNRVIELNTRPSLTGYGSCAGKTESEGPISQDFDICFTNDGMNQSSWEKAECELLSNAVGIALKTANKSFGDIDVAFAGDLLNQCTPSSYSFRNKNIPFCGLFGACSTMAYSLLLASLCVDGRYCETAVAATSSHFCSAEKQFRYPVEYGSQRSPTSQRTVTGAGAFVIERNKKERVLIPRVLIGKVIDLGVTDSANMGAAMAPAAAESISEFLSATDTVPKDYDMILTGDLGKVGSIILKDYLIDKKGYDISTVHNDCGLIIYDLERQDVDSGGSGCGCSAAVLSSHIMKRMNNKELKKVMFVGTGALMSPLISLQGESIPGIAHIVELNI